MAEVDTSPASIELEDRSARLQQLISPIGTDNPTGDDATYDDDVQRVKMEVDKLGSASAAGVDFEMVVELSLKVLTEKTKDLRVATYLAMGLTKTEGLAGAAEGVAAVFLLIQTYWEDLHPALGRMRARRNALQALSDRLKEWVAAINPVQNDRDALVQAVADMKALQAFVLEEMGENAPAVSGLAKAFENALRKTSEPEPEREHETVASSEIERSESPSSAQTSSASTSTTRAASAAAAASSDFRSVKEAERLVFRIAAFLHEEEATSPVPYKLARTVRWGALQQEPPNDGGTTMLPAPVTQRRTYLTGLLDRGEHLKLVQEIEDTFREAPYWLDLQRYVVTAMDELGAAYETARDVILYELAVLLDRFPGLLDLTFDDHTPFADQSTKMWVETRVAPLAQQDEGTGALPAGGTTDGLLEEQFEEARQKLGGSDLYGALEIMQDGVEQDASPKERFRRRLYVATLCLKGAQPAVARPLFEELDKVVRSHALDQWEPSHALEVWTGLYRCYHLLAGKNPETPEQQRYRSRAEETFSDICRIDARYALSLVGK